MTILVATFSQGAQAWLRLCATTEGQWVLVVTVKFSRESFSLVLDQHVFTDPSLSVGPLVFPLLFSLEVGNSMLGV